MPITGVVCYDGSYQEFDRCIDCHINRKACAKECHVPVQSIKSMRDNHLHRKDANISMSTLIACPRAVAIEELYDLYEPVISGYNKFRGTLIHALMEEDRDPPPWVIRERRIYMDVLGERLTGKPDEVDTKYGILVDYKSKDNLPLRPDESHEFQFNGYAHLLRNGYFVDTNEKANIDIRIIGAHYLTFKTKLDKAFKKMVYPVWSDDKAQTIIEQRMAPLYAWKHHRVFPDCDPYVRGRWKCQCEKWEEQLADRGIDLNTDVHKRIEAHARNQIGI